MKKTNTKNEANNYGQLKAIHFLRCSRWYWFVIVLALTSAITVFLLPEDVYPLFYIRMGLGIIFILFLPGFAFIEFLYPSTIHAATNNERLNKIERAALSFGSSLALIPLVGMLLNFTPWGIRIVPITLTILILTITLATFAVVREYRMVDYIVNPENM